MMRLLLSGCGGRMGKVFAQYAEKQSDCRIVAGIDPKMPVGCTYPVFPSPESCTVPVDVAVDFSHPSSLHGLLAYALRGSVPVVIATTGFSAEQTALIREIAESVPLFFSANMSLGISLMAELAGKAAKILSNSFDIEIIEKHHRNKIDAPSGTALMLAEEMRIMFSTKDPCKNIGIHSIRSGTIAGEHEILFAGHDEVLSIKHTALSREIYAAGAMNAARFLVNRSNGLYTMKDLINAV